LDAERLKELGLTGKEVINMLFYFVGELGEKTRLDAHAEMIEGDWNYSYKVLKSVKEIPVCVAEENIKFKDNLVFIHFHINSPVK